ncbi:hypothetical protein D3C79_358210 [compost metagenome]
MRAQRFQARVGLNQLIEFFPQLVEAQFLVALLQRLDLFFHQPLLLGGIIPAPRDRAALRTALVAGGQRHLQRRAKIFGDLRQLLRAGDRQQPHHQEERHHGGHKVSISNLPGATVVRRMMRFAFPDQHNRVILLHTCSSSVACCTGAFTRRTCSSSSTKDGRSVVYSVLRPNSTAICGA